jgi:hypothetical protein
VTVQLTIRFPDFYQNMPPKAPEGTQHSLTFTLPRDASDPLIGTFLAACGNNDAALALQLAPDRDASVLTFGLNKAVGEGHLDLARQLLGAGAKRDTRTVHLAAKSLNAVKFLVESGFDVNTGLAGAATLLR